MCICTDFVELQFDAKEKIERVLHFRNIFHPLDFSLLGSSSKREPQINLELEYHGSLLLFTPNRLHVCGPLQFFYTFCGALSRLNVTSSLATSACIEGSTLPVRVWGLALNCFLLIAIWGSPCLQVAFSERPIFICLKTRQLPTSIGMSPPTREQSKCVHPVLRRVVRQDSAAGQSHMLPQKLCLFRNYFYGVMSYIHKL